MKGYAIQVKGISISCIEETVDAAMEHLPLSLDLSSAADRKKVRDWMVRICGRVTTLNVSSFSAAAKQAIDEAGAAAIDPRYYAKKMQRGKAYRTRRAAVTKAVKMTRAEKIFASLDSNTTTKM